MKQITILLIVCIGMLAFQKAEAQYQPKRVSKKYHYVHGRANFQILPTQLYNNAVEEPTIDTPQIQIWTVFLPKVKGKEVSKNKGYYFVFYIKRVAGNDNFNTLFEDFFNYRYSGPGDYFEGWGTKIPRTVKRDMKNSEVPTNIWKSLQKDKFRLAVGYDAGKGKKDMK